MKINSQNHKPLFEAFINHNIGVEEEFEIIMHK